MEVIGRGASQGLRHGRVRETTAIVRSDVRAAREHERENNDGREVPVHRGPQLFGAPPAAHAARSAVAAAFEPVPFGGMLPPSQLRHDCAGSARGAFVVRMYPFPVSHEYAFAEVDIWLWQPPLAQLPIVPVARYVV